MRDRFDARSARAIEIEEAEDYWRFHKNHGVDARHSIFATTEPFRRRQRNLALAAESQPTNQPTDPQ